MSVQNWNTDVISSHEIVFTVDAEFYLVGYGADLELKLSLTSAIHVDHHEPFNNLEGSKLLAFVENAICFDAFEGAYCIG